MAVWNRLPKATRSIVDHAVPENDHRDIFQAARADIKIGLQFTAAGSVFEPSGPANEFERCDTAAGNGIEVATKHRVQLIAVGGDKGHESDDGKFPGTIDGPRRKQAGVCGELSEMAGLAGSDRVSNLVRRAENAASNPAAGERQQLRSKQPSA